MPGGRPIGDARTHLGLSERVGLRAVVQVLEGLAYLHAEGVIHRDIKGANILTTKEGKVKLADFGVATRLADLDPQAVVGTPYWMAPEVIEMSGVSTACDIWSVGCTVIELLTGQPPYAELAPMPALFRIVQDDHPPVPEGASTACRDFLMQCFQKDAHLRVAAKKLLKHQWILAVRRNARDKHRRRRNAAQPVSRTAGVASDASAAADDAAAGWAEDLATIKLYNETMNDSEALGTVRRMGSLARRPTLSGAGAAPGVALPRRGSSPRAPTIQSVFGGTLSAADKRRSITEDAEPRPAPSSVQQGILDAQFDKVVDLSLSCSAGRSALAARLGRKPNEAPRTPPRTGSPTVAPTSTATDSAQATGAPGAAPVVLRLAKSPSRLQNKAVRAAASGADGAGGRPMGGAVPAEASSGASAVAPGTTAAASAARPLHPSSTALAATGATARRPPSMLIGVEDDDGEIDWDADFVGDLRFDSARGRTVMTLSETPKTVLVPPTVAKTREADAAAPTAKAQPAVERWDDDFPDAGKIEGGDAFFTAHGSAETPVLRRGPTDSRATAAPAPPARPEALRRADVNRSPAATEADALHEGPRPEPGPPGPGHAAASGPQSPHSRPASTTSAAPQATRTAASGVRSPTRLRAEHRPSLQPAPQSRSPRPSIGEHAGGSSTAKRASSLAPLPQSPAPATIERFVEPAQDDFGDLFGAATAGMAKLALAADGPGAARTRASSASDAHGEHSDDDAGASSDEDPFADLGDEDLLPDMDETERGIQERHNRLATELFELVMLLANSRTETDATVSDACTAILAILQEDPGQRDELLHRHGSLPLLDMVEAVESRCSSIIAKVLHVVNVLICDHAESQEGFSLVGGIPAVAAYAASSRPPAVRMEAAVFVHQLCSTNERTLHTFVSCCGLPILVGLLEDSARDDLGWRLTQLALDSIWGVFELESYTPRNEFCRLFAKAGLLPRLARTLRWLVRDTAHRDESDMYAERAVDILLLLSNADTSVKLAMSVREVLTGTALPRSSASPHTDHTRTCAHTHTRPQCCWKLSASCGRPWP